MMIEKIGRKAMLLQMAEETAELAQAALKLVRVWDGKNPTPVTEEEAVANLREEYTDVMMCANELGIGCIGYVKNFEINRRSTVMRVAAYATSLTIALMNAELDTDTMHGDVLLDDMDYNPMTEARILVRTIHKLIEDFLGIEVDQKQVGDKELRFLKRWEEAHGNS